MTYLNKQQIQDYIERLCSLTLTGKIEWHSFEESEYGFYSILRQTSVWVMSLDEDDLNPFRMTIDRLNPEDLNNPANLLEEVESDPSDPETNRLLERLYNLAKRQALDIDTVVGTILDDLLYIESDREER